MFSFNDLCARPVAAADYLALTGAYHTLALRAIPVFKAANRSEAYRFVTLIDVMYENRSVGRLGGWLGGAVCRAWPRLAAPAAAWHGPGPLRPCPCPWPGTNGSLVLRAAVRALPRPRPAPGMLPAVLHDL
jgi:hypothetical protein